MTPANRSDAFSEHIEYLSRKMIERLPETLERQYIRAVAAISNGRRKLTEMRETLPDINLSEEEIEAVHTQVLKDSISLTVPWRTRYLHYQIEWDYLSDLLDDNTLSSTELDYSAKRRTKIDIKRRKLQKLHNIKACSNDSNDTQLKIVAQRAWIDDIADELRVATVNEQYSKFMLYDHGHRKHHFPCPKL